MTEDRKTELLERVKMIATDDPDADDEPGSDIKVSSVGTDSYLVDILVHYVITEEDSEEEMRIHFAACMGFINNANQYNKD